MSKANVFFILLLLIGCKKEPCLDIAELDRQSAATKQWYVNDSIGNQTLTDENGISQTLIVSSRDSVSYDDSVEDDCGNIYGSFRFSIQYNLSISQVYFAADVNGSGLAEDGFYLKISVMDLNGAGSKYATYDFMTKSCEEDGVSSEVLDEVQIGNRSYTGVLHVSFNHTGFANDIKSVYYAKGVGIIKFAEANGNAFEVD